MNLLVFSPYYPPHIGGLESHADEFNKHLSARGVRITVFTPRLPETALPQETRHESVRVLRFPAVEPIPNYPLPAVWLPLFWKLLQAASTPKPDVIISRTRFFSTSLFALLYAKIRRVPLLHIEHGSDFASFREPWKTTLGKWYDRIFGVLVLRYADVVIANSLASSAFVKRLSGTEARALYRGVDQKNFSPHPLIEVFLGERKDRMIIGFIGRLIDGKGVNDLLAAIIPLLHTRDDFVVFLLGDGPERSRIEATISHSEYSSRIFSVGQKEHDEAMRFLQAFDIFVHPSYTEGLPTSVVEAALAKKAIIATDVGGTCEIISGKGDGFLIPPKSPEVLREKIEYLLEHPEVRKEFGEAAQRSVATKFDWNTTAARSLELLETLAEKRLLGKNLSQRRAENREASDSSEALRK